MPLALATRVERPDGAGLVVEAVTLDAAKEEEAPLAPCLSRRASFWTGFRGDDDVALLLVAGQHIICKASLPKRFSAHRLGFNGRYILGHWHTLGDDRQASLFPGGTNAGRCQRTL